MLGRQGVNIEQSKGEWQEGRKAISRLLATLFIVVQPTDFYQDRRE